MLQQRTRFESAGGLCVRAYLAAILFVSTAAAQFDGGQGTPEDPYLIRTPAQLDSIGQDPNHWDRHFRLVANIDLSEYADNSFHLIGTPKWIYGQICSFTGTFDGMGHTIRNFNYRTDQEDPVGLFRRIVNYQQPAIKNLRLEDPFIEATQARGVGALTGELKGELDNCHVLGGSVTGGFLTGGLVGSGQDSTLQTCSSDTDTTGTTAVGGLIGQIWEGTLQDCHAQGVTRGEDHVGGLIGGHRGDLTRCTSSGSVSGQSRIGGLVGSQYVGSVQACGSSATVTGTDTYAGGLLGHLYYYQSKIEACYAEGSVTGNRSVGGVVGYAGGPITDCYASGSVSGLADVGGFVGTEAASIQFCYSSGAVQGTETSHGFGPAGNAYLCFWDTETSGTAASGAGQGLTTARMMNAASYAGWGQNGQWVLDEGQDYPRLAWEQTTGALLVDPPRVYAGGTGRPNDPYLIVTAQHLATIGRFQTDWDMFFRLEEDIDMGTIDTHDMYPIGNAAKPFRGEFDGSKKCIRHLRMEHAGTNHVSLFGLNSGEIRNLHLEQVTVTGGRYVGGLVGANQGIVTECSVTGAVTGTQDVGGLAGGNTRHIERCLTHAHIQGNTDIGGLVGVNHGEIQTSAAEGRVQGDTAVGGLVGMNSGPVIGSYALAEVEGTTQVGGLVGGTNGPRGWYACPSPPPSFVPGLAESRVTACYSLGAVTGETQVGGLVGYNAGLVEGSYAAGPMTVEDPDPTPPPPSDPRPGEPTIPSPPSPPVHVGGLIGQNDLGLVHLSYWDNEQTGMTRSAGGMGRSSAEMTQPDTFGGWDYYDAWSLLTGEATPHLTWCDLPGEPLAAQPGRYGPGQGTLNDPYQIWNVEHLINIGTHPRDWDSHFALMNDLDLAAVSTGQLLPIGIQTHPFSGSFAGNHHTINGLTLVREDVIDVGLFGVITDDPEVFWLHRGIDLSKTADPNTHRGSVSNLNLMHVDVNGLSNVGALAGRSTGAITNCSVTGHGTAQEKNAGGLVGMSGGLLRDCTVSVSIQALAVAGTLAGRNVHEVVSCTGSGSCNTTGRNWNTCTGGLVGENNGTLRCSHFDGNVTGDHATGGLAGLNEGSIHRCSSRATVTGSMYVGGLVGYHSVKAIQECFSDSTILGEIHVGGLAGRSSGSVLNCFALGRVQGDSVVGGLVGDQRYDDVLTSYAACVVKGEEHVGGYLGKSHRHAETVSGFWDIDISTTTDGVASDDPDPNTVGGLSTATMQTSVPFLKAGWDFAGETDNGSEDLWRMPLEGGYPRLSWEGLPVADCNLPPQTDDVRR